MAGAGAAVAVADKSKDAEAGEDVMRDHVGARCGARGDEDWHLEEVIPPRFSPLLMIEEKEEFLIFLGC